MATQTTRTSGLITVRILLLVLGLMSVGTTLASESIEKFIKAVMQGDTETVERLIDERANVDAGSYGIDPLSLSILGDHKDTAQLLLDNGAKFTSQTALTILEQSNTRKDSSPLSLALVLGMSPSVKLSYGGLPLTYSTHSGRIDFVKLLVKHGANVNSIDAIGRTALNIAVKSERIDLIRFLLSKGANINQLGPNEQPALLLAIENRSLDIVRLLIDEGADTYYKTKEGLSLAIIAIDRINKRTPSDKKRLYKEIAILIIKKGVDLEAVDHSGMSVLMMAAKRDDFELVSLLLEKGANVNHQDENSYSAIFLASSLSMFSNFLKAGANIEQRTKNGGSLISVHIGSQHEGIVRKLLKLGVDGTEQRLLDLSVTRPSSSIVELLILNGAEVNPKRNRSVFSPLHRAAKSKYPDNVATLLKYKAEIDYENDWGFTAILLAAKHGRDKSVKILLEHGANPNYQDDLGNTALMLAGHWAHYGVVKELLFKKTTSINARNRIGETALIIAAGKGYIDIVEYLLKRGANTKYKTNFVGTTPMVAKRVNGENVGLRPMSYSMREDYPGKPRGLEISAEEEYRRAMERPLEYTVTKSGDRVLSPDLAVSGSTMGKISGKPFRDDTALSRAKRHGHTDIVKLLIQYK